MLSVSVLMPCYNAAGTLPAALDSLRSQTLTDFQVVAVDDGSTDRSREILARLEAEGLVDRLILHEKNEGKGRALATGFAAASGNVMVIQDDSLLEIMVQVPESVFTIPIEGETSADKVAKTKPVV